MPIIPSDQIQDIRDKTDIVDLVASYGLAPVLQGRIFKCVCPFHDDHNPSLNLDRERQRFRCWVDGARGDVYDFVMQYERVEFGQAVETLARRLGIELRFEGQSAQEIQKSKERGEWKNHLYDQNMSAMKFYKSCLSNDDAAEAREYLQSRNLSDTSIDQFDVGWSPRSGRALFQHLRTKKETVRAMITAGLVSEYNGEAKDYFTAQIIFPFRDVTGRVTGFSARKLPGDERKIGKYINTKTTPVFHKSKAIYGIHQARQHISKKKRIVLCEGQMDVIMCHQFAFNEVVALSGTAAGLDGLRIIKRYAQDVVVLTDGDEPGQKAAERMVPMFLELGIAGRIGVLPDESDPADMLANKQESRFAEIIETAGDAFAYKLDRWVAPRDLRNPRHVSEIADEMMRTASASQDTILRERMRHQLAGRLFVKDSDLSFVRHRSNAAPAVQQEKSHAPDTYPEPVSIRDKAERDMLRTILQDLTLIDRAYEYTDLDFNSMTGPGHRQLSEAILEADQTVERPEGEPITLRDILDAIGEDRALRQLTGDLGDEIQTVKRSGMDDITEFDIRARKLCSMMVDDRIRVVQRDLAHAREHGIEDSMKQLERQVVVLMEKRRRYQSPGFRR